MQWLEEKLIYSQTKTKLIFVKFLALPIILIRKLFNLPYQNILKTKKEINYKLDLDEAIDFCLYLTGEYEPELTQAYAPLIKDRKMIIIDIGANIGAHTFQFAKLTDKDSLIYAIEPTDFAFNKLEVNINLNPNFRKKIINKKLLLTNPEGNYSHQNISASWSINQTKDNEKRNPFDGGFACSTKDARKSTLDQFIKDENIKQVDLIKIDVDGNEIDVLKGAKETFKNFSPILLIELSAIHFDNPNQPYQFKNQLDLLNRLDYEFQDIFGQKITLQEEKIKEKIKHGTLMNIIGFPIEK